MLSHHCEQAPPAPPAGPAGGGCVPHSGTAPRLVALASILLTYCASGAGAHAETVGAPGRGWTGELRRGVDRDYPHLDQLYRTLHAQPELSKQEQQTAARMARELTQAGFQVTTGVGGHGVVGILRNGPGRTIMVRADMDALPVTETTGAPYASKVRVRTSNGTTGVMHACGHDVHMAVLIGTARQMHRLRHLWAGTLLFVAQPSEEVSGGAQGMLDDGLFQRFPRPDLALALHTGAELRAGTVGVTRGSPMANVTTVEMTVRGRGGHGAYPHRAIDPIVLSAQIIMALQTVVSREVDPTDAAVVTVGSIHGGTRPNIIPEAVTLELTIRTHREAVRQQVIQAVTRLAQHQGRAAGLPPDRLPLVRIRATLPAVINDGDVTQQVVALARALLGADQVVEQRPSMGAEDFALYGAQSPRIPSFMFRLGVVSEEAAAAAAQGQPLPALHSPNFLPDREPTLRTGVTTMTAVVIELLQNWSPSP